MTTRGGPTEKPGKRETEREWHVRVRSGDLAAQLLFVVAPDEASALAIGRARVNDPRAQASAVEVVLGV